MNVTGSKVREDFANAVTRDLQVKGSAGGEGERCGVDLCQRLVDTSKGRETLSDSKWMG